MIARFVESKLECHVFDGPSHIFYNPSPVRARHAAVQRRLTFSLSRKLPAPLPLGVDRAALLAGFEKGHTALSAQRPASAAKLGD